MGAQGEEGRLVDYETGVLRRGRVLVMDAPSAVLFIGLGTRAVRLVRFALGEDDRQNPLAMCCKQIEDEIEEKGAQEPRWARISRAVSVIEDRALRRLAIAELLAKGSYNPDEPRVPAGNPDGGQWTTDSEGNIGAGSAEIDLAAFRGATPEDKSAFVNAHLADTQKVADELGVPVENILGLAALESGWGTASRFVTQGNNFFSIHYPAPFATGYILAAGGKKVATFADYADSLRSFAAISGSLGHGKSDPVEFARALQNSGKFGINPDGSKVPDYVSKVVSTIRGVAAITARQNI